MPTVAHKGANLTLNAERVSGAGGQLELKFQTAPKPGTGSGSAGGSTGGSTGGGSSSSGGGGGGSSSSSKPSTSTGTTTRPDGTKVQTETKADGTKIQTTTNKDGSTVKTTTNPNGSSVTENKAANGSTGTVKTDKNGQTTAETALSSKAIEDAKKSGKPVTAPVEVEATRDSSTAPTVKIELPRNSGDTKVEIPVSNVKPGTVAVLVHPDGTEEIVKNSLPTEDGIQLTVNGGATVKIVDNSKDFADTRNHWAKDAIDFVSARGLVNGMSATIYAPNASTTRAQLWTILARQNDADLTGGNTWFENAQNWAKAKGISDGANPNGTINRAQMVTMLWRAMGEPAAASGASFADVPADSYYAGAVAWAVENGITTGVGGGRFDPNATCTRGQIASFPLYEVTQKQPRFLSQGTGAVWVWRSCSGRKRNIFCAAGINEGYLTSKNGKCAVLASGRPAFRQHAEHAEGSDTTHASHTRKTMSAGCTNPDFDKSEKDHAAQRGRDTFGTATSISASLSRRLSAFFGSTHDQAPKAAKFAVLNPGHAGFPKRVERSEGSNSAPIRNAPCFAVCAVVCDPLSRAECVPAFGNTNKRGPFVGEVEKRDERWSEIQLLLIVGGHREPGNVCI